MQQHALWHDSTEDALRSLVDQLGGFKRIGSSLRPSMSADQAGRWLAQCLDSTRPEKLGLDDLVWLLAEGRRKGCHVAAAYILRTAGYKAPEVLDAETELQRLQRQFVEATQALSLIGREIEAVAGQVGSRNA